MSERAGRARLDRPIIIVGAHRSGTTFLGGVIAQHPGVAFWEEPRHVWTMGHGYRKDDVLTARDASARIARKITEIFASYTAERGRARFAEKTPSNCLRLEFIEAIFPDAVYVHIYRDGRAVVSSTMKMLGNKPQGKWVVERLKGTPIWEWPAYAPRAARTIGRKLLGKDMSFWGPRPPGWREWVKRDPAHVRLARQWVGTVEPALAFRERVDPSRWLDAPYERVVTDPAGWATRVLEHAGLEVDAGTLEYIRREADAGRRETWREALSDSMLEEMRPVMEPTMRRFGYAW